MKHETNICLHYYLEFCGRKKLIFLQKKQHTIGGNLPQDTNFDFVFLNQLIEYFLCIHLKIIMNVQLYKMIRKMVYILYNTMITISVVWSILTCSQFSFVICIYLLIYCQISMFNILILNYNYHILNVQISTNDYMVTGNHYLKTECFLLLIFLWCKSIDRSKFCMKPWSPS